MLRQSLLLSAALFSGLTVADALQLNAYAHGGVEGEELEPGEFRARPVITIEGHGGFENNLEGKPEHYAIDGLFGGVLEWGLENGGSFAIEAQVGPAAVWGEAEHFYGLVHVEEHEDEHHDEEEGDDDHAEEEHEDHGHSSGSPYRRTDVKGYVQVRYEPNEKLAFSLSGSPTRDR